MMMGTLLVMMMTMINNGIVIKPSAVHPHNHASLIRPKTYQFDQIIVCSVLSDFTVSL